MVLIFSKPLEGSANETSVLARANQPATMFLRSLPPTFSCSLDGVDAPKLIANPHTAIACPDEVAAFNDSQSQLLLGCPA